MTNFIRIVLVTIAIMFLGLINQAHAQDYRGWAKQFHKASITKKYLNTIADCEVKTVDGTRVGACKNAKTAKDANRLRPKALDNCDTGYPAEFGLKVANDDCKKKINSTPAKFIAIRVNVSPSKTKFALSGIPYANAHKDPCDGFVCVNGNCISEGGRPKCFCSSVSSGDQREKTCKECPPAVQQEVFICGLDGRKVKNSADCPKSIGMKWFWLLLLIGGFLAISLIIAVIGWRRAGNRYKNVMDPTVARIIEANTSPPTGPPLPEKAKPQKPPAVIKSPDGTMLGVIDPNLTQPPLPEKAEQSAGSGITGPMPRELPISPATPTHDHTLLGVHVDDLTAKPADATPDDKSGDKK